MKVRGTVVGTPIKPEKVLVKSENLTEEEKVKARANIGASSMLIVTASADGKASHTVEEICDAHKKGAVVSFVDVEGVSHMPILIAETGAAFERVVVSEAGVVQVVVMVENEDNITVHRGEYIAESAIDDTTESTEKTWSSKNVATEIKKSASGVTSEYKKAIADSEEAGYKKAVETFCPKFEKVARLVQCYPLCGYPYTVGQNNVTSQGFIGVVVVCGKNLYDKITYPLDTVGYPYSNTQKSGAFSTTSTAYRRTGFIPIAHLVGQTIVLSHCPYGTNPGMSFYTRIPNVADEEDCKAAWCGGTTGASIKVPDNAQYMVFCVKAEDANADVQIELGSKSTEYEVYSEKKFGLDEEIKLREGLNTIYAYEEDCVVSVKCREDISVLVRNMQNYISMG